MPVPGACVSGDGHFTGRLWFLLAEAFYFPLFFFYSVNFYLQFGPGTALGHPTPSIPSPLSSISHLHRQLVNMITLTRCQRQNPGRVFF